MTSGNAYRGGSPDGARPRRNVPAPPQRISWRAANRIISGRDGGPGTEDLHALITAASMSTSTSTRGPASSSASFESAGHADAEAASAAREAVLTAYRESAAAWDSGAGRRQAGSEKTAHKTTGSRHTARARVLRFATAVLLVCGVGAAAASVGVLPAGVQRIAHDYFGIGGVSAPSTHVPSSSAVTAESSKPGSRSGAAMPPSATSGVAPASSGVIVSLCRDISQGKGDWESAVDAADQATLITAAGGEQKVEGYCARLLAGEGTGNGPASPPAAPAPKGPTAGPTAEPTANGRPSPAPSAEPTETHGKTHVSRSPAGHGSG